MMHGQENIKSYFSELGCEHINQFESIRLESNVTH